MGIKAILRKTLLKKLVDWYKYRKSDFARFEDRLVPSTRRISQEVLSWADSCASGKQEIEREELFLQSTDPLVKEAYRLRSSLLNDFGGKYRNTGLRVLVHVADPYSSPAGFSLFQNLIESAEYLGYKVKAHPWEGDTDRILKEFQPNILLTSDSGPWLERIDWRAVQNYRATQALHVGLTASLEEEYNSPLAGRLDWAREHGVNFYYFYDSPEYLAARRDAYQPFFDAGYKIYTYEYTLNPLKYYPVPGIERDINFVMIGSGYNNRSKRQQYIEYLSRPWSKVDGFIYGPGWRGIGFAGINNERDRYIYSRGKIGLNLSVPRQMKWPAVLNERTYMLAACGIPQLTDRPLLLEKRFAEDELFIADSAEEYADLFFYMLNHQDEARERALKALKRVFTEHTNFHRCESFFSQLEKDLFG